MYKLDGVRPVCHEKSHQTMLWLFKVGFVLGAIVVLRVEASKDVVVEMSKTFSKPLEICKKEMDFPESVTQDFLNFWKEDYQLTDRSTGCAIICISSKLDLLDGEFKLHHGNTHEFAKKHGADDAKAKQLVDLIHNCAQSFPVIPDSCELTFNIAKCFKAEIHKLDWAPSMELIVADMLAET